MSQRSSVEEGPRRSGRKRESTVIKIGHHTVLKQNNYVMEGVTYVYGANTVSQVKKCKLNPKVTQKKAPRKLAPYELRRKTHNECVKKRISEKAERRMAWLAQRASILQPFIDSDLYDQLISTKSVDGAFVPLSHQPDLIRGDLRDYQLDGLNFMVEMHMNNLGMILGDEMGLGKTLQTISLLCYLKEKEGITGPSLVICPLSVLYSWCHELQKWAPSLKFLRFHSSCETERNSQRDTFTKDSVQYDVVVTTYEMAKQPQLQSLWSRQYFNYLILDEGHKIKNADAQISRAVRGIHCENALILTGTPLQNNLVELWSLLNFLFPDIFLESEYFAQAFNLTSNLVNHEILQKAQLLLQKIMKRRLKDEVERLMPKKIETKVLCPLSSTQVFWYKGILLKDISLLGKSFENSDADTPLPTSRGKVLSNLIMQLRKCCLHPFLFPGAELSTEQTSLKELIGASGKLAVLDKLLRSLFQKGHRTVLFSQFTSVLDILEDYCIMRQWKYCRFDGSTARAMRNYIVNSFNAPDSQKFIFLMSTRSGGMGLNLQTADTCILYDSDWNPQPDLQAMARVHRIGQKKTVHVYRLITEGSIEERMVERAEKKLFMDRVVNAGEEEETSNKDVLSTLQFGCNAVFGQAQHKLPSDRDIAIITDRSRTEEFSEGNLKGGMARKTVDFKADSELTATTQLAGINFGKIREEHKKRQELLMQKGIPKNISIGDMWQQIQTQKRERKSTIIMVEGKGSGYGKVVPVLAQNNYELDKGESSVFQTELKVNREDYELKKRNIMKSGVDFREQDFCQLCGDGGELVLCPRCPVAVHLACSGVSCSKNFMCCSHHHCGACGKNNVAAGGLLYACQSCPNAYCEDCIPADARILGDCERFLELGYSSTRTIYIHCCNHCENIAKQEFGWTQPSVSQQQCPPAIDVSDCFGAKVEEALEVSYEKMSTQPRTRQRGKKYSFSEINGIVPATCTKALPQATPTSNPEGTISAGPYEPPPTQYVPPLVSGPRVVSVSDTHFMKPPSKEINKINMPASQSTAIFSKSYTSIVSMDSSSNSDHQEENIKTFATTPIIDLT